MSQFTYPWVQQGERSFRGIAALIAALARGVYRVAAPILRRFPGPVFFAAVIGVCVVVWAYVIVTRFADGIAQSAANTAVVTSMRGALTLAEIQAWRPAATAVWPESMFSGGLGALAYVVWPLQFALVRDLIAMTGIIGFISLVPLYTIWWERKVAGRIQSRLGPMRVGGWHGWAQSPADGLKLICKEDFIPKEGDGPLFRLAPYLAFVPAICAFIALPFAGSYVFRDLDVALLFILSMLGIEVIGVIIAGWASNNKWSVYGAMREACQMVSYEIPMGMALLIPVMTVGSLRLMDLAEYQRGGFAEWLAWRNPWCFIAFFSYYVASLASCKRAPFDLPESESELVAGFHTEYSGFRWSLFFFAEYAAMFAVSGLAVILFLGGWYGPFPQSWAPTGSGVIAAMARGVLFDGPIIFILKGAFLLYVQIWIRWTLPRIRIDQVLYACVQVLLPLTMIVLLGNTIWVLFDRPAYPGFQSLARVISGGLTIIGLVLTLLILGFMAYGYIHRRRLVGWLAIEHLPGS
ncbi:MAG: NADH-quinone oxidoreductase subunit NuoH [Phycisphaerae bacterium]|nr:NADH-quinone oxidoreductase subunit NuoH [Phycisphaerae bacterium]